MQYHGDEEKQQREVAGSRPGIGLGPQKHVLSPCLLSCVEKHLYGNCLLVGLRFD